MGQKTMILAIVLIILTIFVSVILVVGRIRSGSKNTPEETVVVTEKEVENRNLVSAIDILNSPVVYEGYNVEIDSDITTWVTNKSFYIGAGVAGGNGLFGGNTRRRELLVVSPKSFNLPQDPKDGKIGLGEFTKVSVKGQVQILNREELEAILGVDLDSSEISLDSSNIDRWYLGPVIVATSIEENKEIPAENK